MRGGKSKEKNKEQLVTEVLFFICKQRGMRKREEKPYSAFYFFWERSALEIYVEVVRAVVILVNLRFWGGGERVIRGNVQQISGRSRCDKVVQVYRRLLTIE